MARMNRGRRKLEMKKIENEKNLQVTFSKRRKCLFQKASELCILCGTEAAIIVCSPSGKVFSFGHPSVEEVADRFLTGQVHHPTGTSQLLELGAMYQELAMVNDQLELEKKRGEELSRRLMESQAKYGLEKPVEELNDIGQLKQLKASLKELKDIDQLDQLKASLEELKISVTKEAENQIVAHQNANLASSSAQFQLETGSGMTCGFGQVGDPGNNVGFIGGPENNVGFIGGPESNVGLIGSPENNFGFIGGPENNIGFTGDAYNNIGFTGGPENIVRFTGGPENDAGFTGDGYVPFNAWGPGYGPYGGPGYGGPGYGGP